MAGRHFLHLCKLEDLLLNCSDFLDTIDFECDNNIDIVQLPLDNVDQVSNHKEEDLLEDIIPYDVPGKLELRCTFLDTTYTATRLTKDLTKTTTPPDPAD